MSKPVTIFLIVLIVILTIGVILFPASPYKSPRPTPYADIVDDARFSVVSVWSSRNGIPLNQGSGFYINVDGYLLTNFHVIENADDIRIGADPEKTENVAQAEVIATNAEYDLALLRVEANIIKLMDMTTNRARQGDRVLAIGYPETAGFEDIEMTVTSGVVSRVRYDEFGTPLVYQTDAYFTYGSSGGPMYDIDVGGIIGICTWSHHDENDNAIPNINYALSIDTALSLFDEYLSGDPANPDTEE